MDWTDKMKLLNIKEKHPANFIHEITNTLFYFFICQVICLLARVAIAQYQAAPASQQQTSTTKIFYPAAPLHYVNIGSQLAGDYKFGYDTGKGPLGQSFREEMRLADGSVKGTYGVIDESGHKRVVHYSAGKSGFIAELDPKTPNPEFSVVQRHPKLSIQQDFKSFSHQFPVFKPTNYLQSRTIQPMYTSPVSEQAVKTDVPDSKLTAVGKVEKSVTPFYRLPTPLQPLNIAVPVYRSSAPTNTEQAVAAVSRGQTTTGAQEQQHDAAGVSVEVYKPIKRVTKKPNIRGKHQKVQKARKQTEEQSYDPKVEDDYYDSSPAFIDIERLSYNIGTDRSSASV